MCEVYCHALLDNNIILEILGNTRMCEICSKLTITTPERRP